MYYPGSADRANGSVTLSLTAYSMDPCTDSISDDILVDLVCTGVSQQENETFAVVVQPNPSSGIFHVNISGVRDQNVHLSVTDLNGRVVYNDAITSVSSTLSKKIDLTSLSKGTYIFKVLTNKDQDVHKIVIH